MLSYDNDISIDQMINMICKNQNKINNLKNDFNYFCSDMNFIQCEIPKFFNEILFDLDVFISILKNLKCTNNDLSNQNNDLYKKLNQSQCDNLSLENMLCNAKQSILELERINQCQQNYINELLNKNNLYNQNNNSLLDDKLVNCEKYFSNLPKTTSIDYDNYNLKCDYEKKLNFDYNIDNNCIKNSPRYFEKLLNLTYSYGKNMTPNILNQSSVNSTQLSQMNNFPESFNNSEMKSERFISNYNDKGNKINNINNNMYKTIEENNKQQDNINNSINNKINNNDNINNFNNENENNINELKNQTTENNENNIELKDKINKVNTIINEVLKDEKTIQELKNKLGDDFETRLREGDIDEEYLSKIEQALKEIEEQNKINETNNNSNYKVNKKLNNKNWYRPEFKNPYFPNPQKKFKNNEQNDLYNKIKLKKKITDHQYHYKEYPKAWSSSKDYFTNNKSYDKNYKKNTMKIPNFPK